jgi:hypothetical protein
MSVRDPFLLEINTNKLTDGKEDYAFFLAKVPLSCQDYFKVLIGLHSSTEGSKDHQLYVIPSLLQA